VFEKLLVDDGILIHKYWLTVDQQHQKSDSRSAPWIR
jgi:polyphosphate kinase 2 (PPK2 family)